MNTSPVPPGARDDPHHRHRPRSSRLVFQRWFSGPSWNGWRAIVKAAHALPLTVEETEFFKSVAGGREPPRHQPREIWAVIGRRGGKDSVASAIASHAAASFNPAGILRPGERAVVACIAVDKETAKIIWRYTRAFFDQIPPFKRMVTRIAESDGVIELSNAVDILIFSGRPQSLRRRPILCAVLDECAHSRDETSSTPDVEIANAILPGMATIPQAQLIGISTPPRRGGLLYERWSKHLGANSDDVLVIHGASHVFNPVLDTRDRDRMMEEDPARARAEWYAEWRDDLTGFITRPEIEVCIDCGTTVRAPQVVFSISVLLTHRAAAAAIASRWSCALPGGGERIDHPQRQGHHDDVSNTVSGLLCLLSTELSGAEGWCRFYEAMSKGQRVDGSPDMLATVVDPVRPPGDWNFANTPPANRTVRVLAPAGATHVYLMDGHQMTVPPDGVIVVSPEDANVTPVQKIMADHALMRAAILGDTDTLQKMLSADPVPSISAMIAETKAAKLIAEHKGDKSAASFAHTLGAACASTVSGMVKPSAFSMSDFRRHPAGEAQQFTVDRKEFWRDRRGSPARSLLPGTEGALSWPSWPVGLFRSQAAKQRPVQSGLDARQLHSNPAAKSYGGSTMARLDHLRPSGLHHNPAYSHVVTASGARTIYISGQVSVDEEGRIVGEGDLAAQTTQVMQNVGLALKAVDATYANIVKITTFVVNYKPELRPVIGKARSVFFEGMEPPASTLVGVTALAAPEWLIEIEAIAVAD